MNEREILKSILNNEKLKEKYWPEIQPEKYNLQSLIRSKNKYLIALHHLLTDTNINLSHGFKGNLKKVFDIN